ncbi:unnamed protein product, partial [Allacma fusca]
MEGFRSDLLSESGNIGNIGASP